MIASALDLLKEARDEVASGAEEYICFALGHATRRARNRTANEYELAQLESTHRNLVQLIQQGIFPQITFHGWLAIRLGLRATFLLPRDAARAGRVAWLDRMIDNIEKD